MDWVSEARRPIGGRSQGGGQEVWPEIEALLLSVQDAADAKYVPELDSVFFMKKIPFACDLAYNMAEKHSMSALLTECFVVFATQHCCKARNINNMEYATHFKDSFYHALALQKTFKAFWVYAQPFADRLPSARALMRHVMMRVQRAGFRWVEKKVDEWWLTPSNTRWIEEVSVIAEMRLDFSANVELAYRRSYNESETLVENIANRPFTRVLILDEKQASGLLDEVLSTIK
jgi:hypothetical protein